tara:strand:+ start:74 stop:370 length:297 start_codon:yes stop_codon:yes gene_type:complete
MKLEELLKPNKSKIILALILFLAFTPVKFQSPLCDSILAIGGCPLQTNTTIGLAIVDNFDRFIRYKSDWLDFHLVLFAIGFYLMSGSIFYNKEKRNKK